MTLPTGTPGVPLSAADAFDVPVFVRRSSPLAPGPNPTKLEVGNAAKPWPATSGVPADGDYLATTTWRDVLKAAVTVGRDIAPWLTKTPELARREIIARRYPLAAYLVRRPSAIPQAGVAREVVPSVIYLHATESSMRSAFGYHVGMTMAEWACRGLMGLGRTMHAENGIPTGATSERWEKSKSLPDLFGTHPSTGEVWLVEAKGGRWLSRPARRAGAKQLQVGSLMPAGHSKVLCATGLQQRLHMAIDVEDCLVQGAAASDDASPDDADSYAAEGLLLEEDDAALLALAQSELLTYLALSSLSPDSLSLVAVASPPTERRRPGLARLLEDDSKTREVRARLGPNASGPQIRSSDGDDMLVGAIPGTDLLLGMSRRLFNACRSLAAAEAELVQESAAAIYPQTSYLQLRELASATEDEGVRWREQLRPLRDTRLPRLRLTTREGFTHGSEADWDELIGGSPRFAIPADDGYLEAATADTYWAVRAESVGRDSD